MAGKKTITNLSELTSAASNDVVPVVDVSDQSVTSSGETKKITVTNLLSGKADSSHTHAISDVTNLQTSLDAKQATVTAGDGLSFSGDTLNAEVTQAELDAKQAAPSEGAFVDGDKTKLDGIETSADVTDATNVEAAGALMDSELTDLAGVKGVTISTLQPKPSEGAFADGDKTKLDNIEASADVTDATNVEAAGALMDSELTDLAGVKGVTISTLQPKPSEGAFADGDKTKLDGITASANNYSHPNHSGEVTSTGDGATVIADDVVDEANLKVSNSPTDGYSLVARSGETGGLKWESVSGGGGGGSVGGSTGAIQFHDGSGFGGSSSLIWDNTLTRLGVGTGSPSKPLHVVGEARFDGTSGAENVYINSGAADSDAYLWFMENGTSKVAVYHDASADALVLKGDSSTDTLTVKGSNVGVGVTDFSSSGANAKLAVNAGFINVDDDYGLVFGGGTGRPAIQGSKADGEIYITNAKLGIGSSSPSSIVHASKSTGVNFQANSRAFFGSLYSNHFAVLGSAVKADDGTTAQMVSTETSSGNGRPSAIQLGAGNIAFHTATSGTAGAAFDSLRMRIDSSGDAGINTTSPNLGSWGKALTINSDSTASSCSLELAQGGTLYGFVGVQGSGSSNALDIAAYQSQDIRFRVGASGGTHAMVIDSSGTTRATGDLIIAHDSTTTDAGNTLAFHTTTAGWATANAHATISGKRTDASNGYLTFSTRGSGTTTERMRIDSSGNFGIGTTSASSKLHLIGEGLMGNATNKLASHGTLELSRAGDPYLFLRNTNSQGVGNSGFIEFYQKNGNGSEVATSRIGGSTEATHATQPSGNLKFYTASSGGSLSERMRISSDGNVSLKGGRLIIGEADVASGHIDSFENLTFNIDTDNDDTNRYFSFTYNASAGAGTEVLRIDEADGAITGGGLKLYGGILGHKDSDASSITLVGGSSSANSGANITLGGTSGSATREVIFKSNSTETMRISADGAIGLAGENYGTSGQVLTSGGSGAAPSWTSAGAGTVTSIDATTNGGLKTASGSAITDNGTLGMDANSLSSDTYTSSSSASDSSGWSAGDEIVVVDSGTTNDPTKKIKMPCEIGIACSDESTEMSTGDLTTIMIPRAMTLTEVKVSLTTPSSSDTVSVDIQYKASGSDTAVTIFESSYIDLYSDDYTNSITGFYDQDTSNPVDVLDLAEDSFITVYLDSSDSDARGLKVWLLGYWS